MSRHRAFGHAISLALPLFAFSFLVRIANIGLVFVGGRVCFPSGRDDLYHVRKIVYQVLRFPEVLDFDPYVSFPFGAHPVWPPFLDWGIAALVRPFALGGGPASVERLIVWLPPLLGAATVAAIGEIGRRHFSWLAGVTAGLLLAAMQAHHVHSQLGQVDHQVVLGLATALLLASAMTLLSRPDAAGSRGLPALAAGAVVAASLLVSPGALLQILPIQGVVAAWALFGADRSTAMARARAGACLNGAAAALLLPACLGNGSFAGLSEYSPLVLSRFQPLWMGAGASIFLGVAELWKRSPAGATRPARVVSAVALATTGAAVALIAIPGLRETLSYAGGWFTRDEAFLTTVVELRPLLFPADRFDPSVALAGLTPALAVFPVAWSWLVYRCARGPARPALSLLLAWSGAFFALALAQERFANVFAPGLALTLGAALEELRGIVQRRLPRPARWAFAVLVLSVSAAALAPSLRAYQSLFVSSRSARTREQPWIPPGKQLKAAVEEAARWLRTASPPTRGFLDAAERPEYGVLTSWDDGHLVRYRAERPTVQDNFGSFGDRRAYELAASYFDTEDEEAAYRVAQQLGARYALATVQGSGQTASPSPRSVAQRMWRLLGSANSSSAALARHRMIWIRAQPGKSREVGGAPPDRVAIFEIVPGAKIEGEAAPGALLDFEILLATRGGHVRYRAHTRASADGRYAIRLPYPTDRPVSSEVRAAGPYQIRSGAVRRELALRETDVRAGATVSGPSLR